MKILFKFFFAIFISILFFSGNAHAQTIAAPIGKSDNPSDSITYSKVEIEASFPGGPAAWTKYITKQILQNADQFRKKDYGTCVVKFIVEKDGHINEVEAVTMKKTRLAKIAVEAIENGPKWIPAQQDGRNVKAYRLQPVILTEPDK